jgi:hypothetical protein
MAQLEGKGDSIEELLCRNVLRIVRNHIYVGRPASESLVDRLEAELVADLRDLGEKGARQWRP